VDRKQLEGRGAIIAGASQGLGRAIARAYVEAGASVALCARGADVLEEARAELAALAGPGQLVVARPCDVSHPAEVQAFVDYAASALPRLDVLVNCAGIYGPKGTIDEIDWLAWVKAVEVNLHGAVLLTREVLPHLKRAGRGKIVHLSGGGATAPLPRLSAYAVSKAGLVRFVETLAQEVERWHIDVNAIAPGALNTRMLDEVLAAGPEKVGEAFYRKAQEQKRTGGAPLERGAALAVFLGSPESDGITGRLVSAVWDPWEELPARRAELAGTDIYTLRRIVPGDRGKGWGSR
jgi:3-oxoacyl-[acyl-carrier protein] reductase